MLPETSAPFVKFSSDAKSILYPVGGKDEVTFYRHKWNDGKLIGKPEVALKLPFRIDFYYGGAGCDFTRDLSMIVYARTNRQDDLYMLSQD